MGFFVIIIIGSLTYICVQDEGGYVTSLVVTRLLSLFSVFCHLVSFSFNNDKENESQFTMSP